jgi:uncharacterized repeat protein (TIGR01451 family)
MRRSLFSVILPAVVLFSLLASSTLAAAAQGTSNLSIAVVADRDKAKPGEMITYSVTITNLGPDVALSVGATNSLSDELNLVSLTCDRGVSPDGDFCEYASLDPGASVVTTYVATPVSNTMMPQSRYATCSFGASLLDPDSVDPDLSNNNASISTRLIAMKSRR